jgi:hypothetical protein
MDTSKPNDIMAMRVNMRGVGMTLASLDWLLKELQSHPVRRTVYVNFELPKWQRERLERYAVIKHISVKEVNGS